MNKLLLNTVSQIKNKTDLFQILRILNSCSTKLSYQLIASHKLTFPASDIDKIYLEQDILTIELSCLSLIGVDGCLPNYFNDFLANNRQSSQRLKDFIDIFHKQFYALSVKAWKKLNPNMGLEFGEQSWLTLLSTLLPKLDPKTDPINLARVLLGNSTTRQGLQYLLKTIEPQHQIKIHHTEASWQTLATDNYLGSAKLNLAENIMLGERYLARAQLVQIQFGPMSYSDFIELKKRLESIVNTVQRYLDIISRFSISALVLFANNLPQLGSNRLFLGDNVHLGAYSANIPMYKT